MRKILFIAVVIFAGLSANAQISFGVKGGVNSSTLSGSGFESVTGYHAGGLMQIKLAMLAVQPEVIFSAQGAKFRTDNIKSVTQDLNYITVPVMLQYYLIPGLNIEVGPQVGFLVSSKLRDGFDKETADFAINFGAGFQIPIIKIGVFARYSLGLTNSVVSAKNVADALNVKSSNRVFQAGVFYRF